MRTKRLNAVWRKSGSTRFHWVTCTAVGCLLLLAAFTIARLIPNVAGTGRNEGPRVAWYFNSGQIFADAKTFTCICKYILDLKDPMPPTLPRTSPPTQIAQWAGSMLVAQTNVSGTNVPTA